MRFDLAKSGGHEVCSRIRARLRSRCIANIRGAATALSDKASAAVQRRSNYHRGPFDSTSYRTGAPHSLELALDLVPRGGLCNLRQMECAFTKLRCDNESATRVPPLRNH